MDFRGDPEQTVVAMSDFAHDTGYSALSQVEAYWDGLRGMRLMPKRAEIDPRGIESALENTFIVERIAPGMARIRIAGSHLGDLMGMEVRGMPITSFVTPDARRQVSDTIEEMFQRPATCSLRLSSPAGVDKPQLEARMLLLPLKSDLGDVSRALGCLVARGEIGRSPRRFDVVGAKIRAIAAPASLPAQVKDPAPLRPTPPAPAKGFSEPSAGFDARTEKTRVPYLRLVKNED
ncbi:MAG: PAS domain-containing protein [Pseudomonadota bacterium]